MTGNYQHAIDIRRAQKVSDFIAAIDEAFAEIKDNTPAYALKLVQAFGEKEWAAFAKEAGRDHVPTKGPGRSREQIVEIFRRREQAAVARGALNEISDDDRKRLILAGVLILECEDCRGRGHTESFYDETGAVYPECKECSGRGAVTVCSSCQGFVPAGDNCIDCESQAAADLALAESSL